MNRTNRPLEGKRVAILATDGVEHVELEKPLEALRAAGAEVALVSPKDDAIRSFDHLDPRDSFPVDVALADARPDDYDALVLPGGVANPDALRITPGVPEFVGHFFDNEKAVAAICHGPWVLVESAVVLDRTLTSWPSLRTDIENAGGRWVDEEVRVDGPLVTSRKPDDLDAFCEATIKTIAKYSASASPR